MTSRLAAIALLLITIGLPSAALASARDDVIAAMGKCAAIADDKARLACYDALSPRVKEALATPPAALDHEPTKQEQESWFGFDFNNLFGGGSTEATTPEQFGKERTPEAVAKRDEARAREAIDSITAGVTDVAFTPFGRFIVFLNNGQVWRQIEGDSDKAHFNGKPSDNTVTIALGAFGSYNLRINDSNHAYKVMRVK